MRIDNNIATHVDCWFPEVTNKHSFALQERIFSGSDTSYSFANRDVVHQPVLDNKMAAMFQGSIYQR